MKIAVFGNLWQDHRVADIRKIVEAVRGSGAFVEVEQAFGDYLRGLVPDFRADKVVGEHRSSRLLGGVFCLRPR